MKEIKRQGNGKIRLIIFDFDGVLVRSSMRLIFEAYKKVLCVNQQDWQKYFKDFDEFKKWWSPNWRANLEKLGIKNEKIIDKVNDIFYKNYSPYSQKIDGQDYFLKNLVKRGYLLAVLTSRHRHMVENVLGKVASFFILIVGAEDVKQLKPHPEGVRLILEKTGLKPESVIIIGDRPEDLQAGIAAGVKTGAMIWQYGLGKEGDFGFLKPDFVFRSYSDILKKFS